jgi:hypothetical protein
MRTVFAPVIQNRIRHRDSVFAATGAPTPGVVRPIWRYEPDPRGLFHAVNRDM